MANRLPQGKAVAAPPPPAEVVEKLVEEARRKLRAAATTAAAVRLRQTYGEQVPCLGVDPAQVHDIGLESVRQMRTGGLALAMAVADPLWRSGILEEGLVAAQVVGAMGRHIGGGDFDRLEAWAKTLTNSATADAFGMSLVAKALAAKPSLVNRLQEWAKSPSPPMRRAAVTSFIPLVREGRFLTDAFMVLGQVMEDPDPQVQDGAGLMLMEASRLQAGRVVDFLRQWKGRSPRPLLARAAQKLAPPERAEVLGA